MVETVQSFVIFLGKFIILSMITICEFIIAPMRVKTEKDGPEDNAPYLLKVNGYEKR